MSLRNGIVDFVFSPHIPLRQQNLSVIKALRAANSLKAANLVSNLKMLGDVFTGYVNSQLSFLPLLSSLLNYHCRIWQFLTRYRLPWWLISSPNEVKDLGCKSNVLLKRVICVWDSNTIFYFDWAKCINFSVLRPVNKFSQKRHFNWLHSYSLHVIFNINTQN